MNDPRIQELRALLPHCMLADWLRLGSRLVRTLRDQHHGPSHEAILERLLAAARHSAELRDFRSRNVPRVSYPPELPITSRKNEILELVRANRVVVVAGETGSGKTTQLPKICLEAGLGVEAKIGCTQPRRVAALSVSRRIAEELQVTWGSEVGCKIRFDDRTGRETYIKLLTDGMLLAELQGDPLLSEYNGIIIDEAHERSLNIDFLLGYLKNLMAKRPDLKLIITSATIDTEAFSKAFGQAPVINVSGRVYPVELVYAPIDAASEEAGEITYVDAAVNAAGNALAEAGGGDILIFMPTERDIRETTDLLKTRLGDPGEIIPLFGRLGSADQQRVFVPLARRKLVVATNIAETSLTIPGIRYVVDAGLARISRYNPRTRTQRLPIEEISQSSANQRKGRAGRVRDGICIRLYSEEDLNARPLYTQPEIQRANLAEVILRMRAFQLGDIETFPFLNPPSPAAIRGGYALLHELGAMDENQQLTPLGKELARLPIDPTLGRMLLQSRLEHATRELLIIAAGLGIQDPRERPAEQKDAATAAHRRFADPRSDFLALLNIWNAVHEQYEKLPTQSQRRKFCRANFLSYVRMREWQDLHAQLYDSLEELGTVRLNESNAHYDAIHRSVLAGLLGHVASREEANLYKGAANRQLRLFPGSALYERSQPKPRGKTHRQEKEPDAEPGKPRPCQPQWIVAGEIVETSQVFARTAAFIEPDWVADLGAHLCKRTYQNPHWDAEAGQVMVEETLTLFGLEMRRRNVAYGNVDAKDATRLFIRSALVEEALLPEPQVEPERAHRRTRSIAAPVSPQEALDSRYPFIAHNRKVRQKIETWQTRMRRHDLPDLDAALADFYGAHLPEVTSIQELNRFLRGPGAAESLRTTESDLVGDLALSYDATAFPDSVRLGGQPVSLSYAYAPGEEKDGVTLHVDSGTALHVTPASLEWAIPGLREGQVQELLRGLPKALRRELMPLAPKVAEIARELHPRGHSLGEELSKFIHKRYGVSVAPSAWAVDAMPSHLRPRIEIVGQDQKPLCAGRDLAQLRQSLEKAKAAPAGDPPEWARLAEKWERFAVGAWNFGDLPERITVKETPAGPMYAWPGLHLEEGQVNLRLFHNPDAARAASVKGVERLLELALQKDLGWLQKDLRAVSRLAPLLSGFCAPEDFQAAALDHLKKHLLPREPLPALQEVHFRAALDQARKALPGLFSDFLAKVEPILTLRQEIVRRSMAHAVVSTNPRRLTDLKQLGARTAAAPAPSPSPALIELGSLLPAHFLRIIPFERLPQIPRYLKALLTRMERARLNPLKDHERARLLAPYREALATLQANPPRSEEGRGLLEEFSWMVEEFKVSLFAQELGTAVPVSAKRLDALLQSVRNS